VSIMYSTSYIYNSGEFIELLLSQPVKRNRIWISLYAGLILAFVFAFMIGLGLPVLIYAFSAVGIMMLVTGILISVIFVSLAMFCSILMRDKAKGIGVSIVMWLFFALLFDGLVLFLLFQLSDYPIEKMMIGISALNPISLARILILLHLDVSAMMGYTGAIFKNFFGTTAGMMISLSVLMAWALIPFLISLFKFKRKDL
jgi:Cu-processing system permease protein